VSLPLLVVVTGEPATGKTTLVRALATELEANFSADSMPRLRSLPPHDMFQILCTAPPEVTRER
jgi:MoxR-like ATPase